MTRRDGLRNLAGLIALAAVGVISAGTVAGCAVSTPATNDSTSATNDCVYHQGVLPAATVADHTAAAPGNQQAFDVSFVDIPPGCDAPLPLLTPQGFTWTSSDPVNAPISNVAATAGVATCVGATTVPATISTNSAGYGAVAVAMLTCK
jgi:hypothetical protein